MPTITTTTTTEPAIIEELYGPAGLGVRIQFDSFVFEKATKDQNLPKDTPLYVFKKQNASDATGVAIPQSNDSLWALTCDHSNDASNATCRGEIVVDGKKVIIDKSDDSKVRQVADEISKFMAELKASHDLIYAQPSQTSDSVDSDHWKIRSVPPANAKAIVHLTTAMPIEGLLALPDSLVALTKIDGNLGVKFTTASRSTRYPIIDINRDRSLAPDRTMFFHTTREKFLTSNSPLWRLSDVDYIPPAFCAFIVLLSLYVYRSNVSIPASTFGPKKCGNIIPCNDFLTLYHHVKADQVMLKYFKAPYTHSLRAVVAWNIGSDYSLSSYALKWQGADLTKPPTLLSAADWLDGLDSRAAQSGKDMLTTYDSKYGDASIGRLEKKMQIIGSASTVDGPLQGFWDLLTDAQTAISEKSLTAGVAFDPIWDFESMTLQMDKLKEGLVELNRRFGKLADWTSPTSLETASQVKSYMTKEAVNRDQEKLEYP